MKGVAIPDLAIQYGASVPIIEMILRNRGIVVMKDVVPEKKARWRKKDEERTKYQTITPLKSPS